MCLIIKEVQKLRYSKVYVFWEGHKKYDKIFQLLWSLQWTLINIYIMFLEKWMPWKLKNKKGMFGTKFLTIWLEFVHNQNSVLFLVLTLMKSYAKLYLCQTLLPSPSTGLKPFLTCLNSFSRVQILLDISKIGF